MPLRGRKAMVMREVLTKGVDKFTQEIAVVSAISRHRPQSNSDA